MTLINMIKHRYQGQIQPSRYVRMIALCVRNLSLPAISPASRILVDATLTTDERCLVLASCDAESNPSRNDVASEEEGSTKVSPSNPVIGTLVTVSSLEDRGSYGDHTLHLAFHTTLSGNRLWRSFFPLQPGVVNGSNAPRSECSPLGDCKLVYCRPLHSVSCFRFQVWDTDVSRSLINIRAWVLQERLLSPRTLYFGAHQLLWECRTKDAAEVYPDGLPSKLFTPRGRFKNLVPNVIVGAKKNCDNVVIDKLMALSAIANTMGSALGDEYVAGMWRCYLERELLWSRADTVQSGSRRPLTTTYRAPTWSWAAVDRDVNSGDPNVKDSDMLISAEGLELGYV
ncbi:hypothetical protein F4782DRAFT_547178 [Xylaria castorea]|nr:hypothetical protein F4782DRAFT_547178 [Xylaria castorea]